MSDLTGGGPSAPAGNGRNNGRFRGAQGVPGTGSPSGIKGPRDIMREREAREARKRAEQEAKEAMERERAEEEAMQIQEANRRAAGGRAVAAGAAQQQRGSGEGGQRGSGGTTGQRRSDNSQRSDRRSGDRVASGEAGRRQDQPLQGVGSGGRAVGGGEATASARPRPTQSQSQQQPRPVQPDTMRRPPQAQAPSTAGPSNAPPPPEPAPATRSSFPHAFERWETLSAHWEGLTSYWIRRLEANSEEIESNALSQQLSRQVTDLSAAGANLFHAVVELQRLRASSERKFQRWFFETRADIERGQEVQAVLQNELEKERTEREAAIAEAVNKERDKSDTEKQLAEMRRELLISKEEAKRAWEELGRREEAERSRVAALRDGQPVTIAGVQVVPMMQGVPSARDRPATREGPYSGGPIPASEPEGPDSAYQEYSRTQRADPADPFVEQNAPRSTRTETSVSSSHEGYSQAPAVQPASTSGLYQHQHQDASLHPLEREQAYEQSVTSEGAFSEGTEYQLNEHGEPIRDALGRKIPWSAVHSDDDTDEYDVEEQRERELATRQRYPQGSSGVEYGRGSTATAGGRLAPSSQPGDVDYSGAGYGGEPQAEWSGVPRHHHPTRLSDVMEEDDERSRTSASQLSRRD